MYKETLISIMETNQNQESTMNQGEVLQEILEKTRKTEKYLRWQLYITLVLVVLPLLAMVFIIPMVLRSLGSAYGGLIQ
ncbi:MAG: hypothetical protein NTX98_00775 [Candidatus Doudnabacteria bacterium]|nr:hypothetical protein [Candidatus Doudnabacteria bacterium]